MYYLGILVLPQSSNEDGNNVSAVDFNFDGVMIGESIKTQVFTEPDGRQTYGVNLRITIDNEKGKTAPYKVDIEISGNFAIIKKIEEEKREEMAIVNGCAILYSAIREQIMALTSRCLNGTLILPTVNFYDKIKREIAPPEIKKSTRKRAVKES